MSDDLQAWPIKRQKAKAHEPHQDFMLDRFTFKLQELRRHYQKTQAEMSHLLGIHIANWRDWEAGDRWPELWRIIHISLVFKVSLDWLLDREAFARKFPPKGRGTTPEAYQERLEGFLAPDEGQVGQ